MYKAFLCTSQKVRTLISKLTPFQFSPTRKRYAGKKWEGVNFQSKRVIGVMRREMFGHFFIIANFCFIFLLFNNLKFFSKNCRWSSHLSFLRKSWKLLKELVLDKNLTKYQVHKEFTSKHLLFRFFFFSHWSTLITYSNYYNLQDFL